MAVMAVTEAQRLLELRRYQILDTPPEAVFDRVTSLAARMFSVPIAIISFVDKDRQWLKSLYGLEGSQTARELSFCHYNIESDEVMVVEDASQDPRFKDNPLVTAEPHLRFYAGAPLITSRGYRLGALCLLDRRPRPFTPKERAMLADLAALVVGGLECRLKDYELTRVQAQSETRSQQRAEKERERLFSLSPDLLCVVGSDGYFKRVNPAWQEVLGYSSEELLAQPFMNFIHPDDHEATRQEVQRLMAEGGQTRSFQNRYLATDGGYRWFLWSAIVYEEERLCYAVARDMTESKRAQEALERNAKRVNNILLSISDAFVSVDNDWRFTYLNPQAERLLKRSKEEVLGKRVGEVLPEALGTRFEGEFREALRTKQPITFEDYYAPLAGWFEVHVYPSDEGVAVYFQNITERKEAKRDLERSLSLLRTTLEATADGIVSVDITGKLITYNHKFVAMWGFPDELLAAGDDARLLDYAARQVADPEGFLRRVQELYASDEGKSYDLLELKDGRVWERHLQLQRVGAEAVGWVWSFRDVSESRRAAEALRQANEFKDRVMESVTEAIVALDLDGNFTFVNRRLCEIVGCNEESLIGDAFFSFVPDGARDELMAQFRLAAAGSLVPPFETALRRQNGTEATVALSFSPLLSGGEVSGVVATAEDITQTKRAMDRLRLLDQAVEHIDEVVLITDPELDYPGPRIVYVNEAFVKKTGYSKEEVLGKTPRILQGPKTDRVMLSRLKAALMRQESFSARALNYYKDGSPYIVEWHISPVRDASGRLTHWASVQRDMSQHAEFEAKILELNNSLKQRLLELDYKNEELERTARLAEVRKQNLEQAAGELANTARQLHTIFALSPDGFVSIDESGRVAYVNDAFLRMTGLAPDEVVGRSEMGLDALIRDLCDPDKPYRSYLGDAETFHDVIHLVRPRPAVLQRMVRTLLTDETELLGRVMYLRDVTHESEVDRMKSEFLSTTAHELRTPMTSIYGFSQLLLERDYDKATSKELIRTIHDQSARLVQLLNELLDLARIEARAGKDFRISLQDIRPLIHATTQSFSNLTTEVMPEHRLEVDLLPLLPTVAIDADKMQQVFTNVLGNAFKYSPGGGLIRLSTRLRTVQGRRQLGVTVKDGGIGMTPEQKSRVFERFYRADHSGAIPGTGLGMSLVKEIMDLHGGSVEIESERGKGTAVTLWIPAEAAVEGEDGWEGEDSEKESFDR